MIIDKQISIEIKREKNGNLYHLFINGKAVHCDSCISIIKGHAIDYLKNLKNLKSIK